MSRKCTKITLGKTNRYIFLIIVGAILRACLTFLESKSYFFANENKHPIVYSITYSLGLCLAFILLIIYKTRNKSAKGKELEKENTINTSFITIKKDTKSFSINKSSNGSTRNQTSKKAQYFWILVISIIDYIAYVFFCIYWVTLENYLNTWAFTIVFMSIFSNKILNIKLYRHHYLCIIVIITVGISYNIIAEKFNSNNFMRDYESYLSFLFTEIIFSLVYVMYKYLIYKKYIKSYEILCIQGIIEFFFGIITFTITSCIGKIDNFSEFINDIKENKKEIAILILLIINQFFVYSIEITIVDMFSPFHVFLENILKEFILFFFMIELYKSNPKVIVLTIVCIIICLIMILIFIEIIQLNFCGLSHMTKKSIQLRATLDSEIDINDDKQGFDYEGYLLNFDNDKLIGQNIINNLNELYFIDTDSINEENGGECSNNK